LKTTPSPGIAILFDFKPASSQLRVFRQLNPIYITTIYLHLLPTSLTQSLPPPRFLSCPTAPPGLGTISFLFPDIIVLVPLLILFFLTVRAQNSASVTDPNINFSFPFALSIRNSLNKTHTKNKRIAIFMF
jgi:hypothetical protein